jgi:hypothetical protein
MTYLRPFGHSDSLQGVSEINPGEPLDPAQPIWTQCFASGGVADQSRRAPRTTLYHLDTAPYFRGCPRSIQESP